MGLDTVSQSDEAREAMEMLLAPLRARLKVLGRTHEYVGRKIEYHQSTVSRALSGRVLPSRQVIMAIAGALDCDVEETGRRWSTAADIYQARSRERRVQQEAGWPPPIKDYPELLDALQWLLHNRRLSHRELADRDPALRRSTVGAVLRGARSARRDMVIAILRECEVSDSLKVGAWLSAWERVGALHMAECHRRQMEGYRRRRVGEAVSAAVERARQHARGLWPR